MRIHFFLILLLILPAIFFPGCSPSKKNPAFQPEAIPSFFANIDITKDTTIHGPGGSIIQIPANALNAGGATLVKLSIKEVFRMSDIIQAGLITSSNGQPLSSGGMIDIEAVSGQTVTITKAIAVKIPASYIEKNMQLYKGSISDQGNLNWTDPQPLPADTQIKALDLGQQIFQNNCATCHGFDRDGTGPALTYIASRRDRKWLYAFTRNNQKVLASGDRYAYCLYQDRNMTPMILFPTLSDAELDAVYAYIENESRRRGLPMPDDHLKKCVDSCAAYSKLAAALIKKRNKLVADNGSEIKLNRSFPSTDTIAGTDTLADYIVGDSSQFISKVSAPALPSEYYQFTIKTFGWYNIDMLTKTMDGVKESELIVRLNGKYRQTINVFLVIPSAKIFTEGGPLDNKEGEYGFYTKDGKLLLPQGVNAVILIMGERDGKMLFDMLSFRTSEKQTLQLQPAPVSKETMNARLQTLDLQDISIKAEDAKNAAAIRQIDRQLKKIKIRKPVSCDCNCGIMKK